MAADLFDPHDHALWLRDVKYQDDAAAPTRETKWKSSMGNRSTPEFEAFYKLYPLKKHPRTALAAWHSALKRASVAEIMAGLAAYRFPADKQFTPHPSSWLNADAWVLEVYTPPVCTAPDARSKTGWMDAVETPQAPIIEGIWE